MLKRWNIVLLLMLLCQLGLLFVFFGRSPSHQVVLDNQSLLVFDRQTLQKILIEEAGGGKLEMIRNGSQWQLGTYHDLPVDQAQLNLFLDAIANWKPGFIYTENSADYGRYEVGDEHYRFRVSIVGQRGVAEVFTLGSFEESGMDRSQFYFHKANTKPVYAVSFAGFLPTTLPHIWLDTALLQMPDKLREIKTSGFDFIYQQGVWRLSGLAADEKQDFVQVVGLVSALQDIQVLGKLDNSELEEQLTTKKADFSFDVETVKGTKDHFSFFLGKQHSFVKSERYPYFFYFSEQTAKLLRGLTRSAFLEN